MSGTTPERIYELQERRRALDERRENRLQETTRDKSTADLIAALTSALDVLAAAGYQRHADTVADRLEHVTERVV